MSGIEIGQGRLECAPSARNQGGTKIRKRIVPHPLRSIPYDLPECLLIHLVPQSQIGSDSKGSFVNYAFCSLVQ